MIKISRCLLFVSVLTSLISISYVVANQHETLAEDQSKNKAYRIMLEAERRDQGWVDSKANMQMQIRRGDGREVVREVRIQSLEGDDGRDKGLMIFDKPLDVRGTVFLTHSLPLESDLQWIYLPSRSQVKRISSKRQTGRFMGSEFTFEDMSSFSLEKNNYQYLGETSCGEPLQDCHIIEVKSKDKYSGYEKTVSYIDKTELRSWKTELYSKRTGLLSKTLTVSDYQLYLGQYWRPSELTMKNEKTGATTTLKWINQTFGIGLDAAEFRKSSLERRQ